MQYKNLAICSIQMLADYMKYDSSGNHKIVSRIKTIIEELIQNKYITKMCDLSYEDIALSEINKDFMFYVEIPEPLNTLYFKVFDRDIDKIYEYLQDKKLNKFSLIRYYTACCRVSNNDASIGYLTQGKLKKLVSDSRTIQKYNNILQDELELIIYNNSYLTPDKHYCTTFIGKWDDEVNFNKQLAVEVSVKGLIHTDKIKSNLRRSKKQEINNIDVKNDKARIKELEEKLKQYEDLQYKPKDEVADVIIEKQELKGLQNRKPLPLPVIHKNKEEEEPYIFGDMFENEDEDYEMTEDDIQAMHEIEQLNRAQIPDEVLREIERMENDNEDDDLFS